MLNIIILLILSPFLLFLGLILAPFLWCLILAVLVTIIALPFYIIRKLWQSNDGYEEWDENKCMCKSQIVINGKRYCCKDKNN